MDPIPRHLERVVGILAEQRVLPPPPPVALAFRDLLAGGVEVSGKPSASPACSTNWRDPGALTGTCKPLLTSLTVP